MSEPSPEQVEYEERLAKMAAAIEDILADSTVDEILERLLNVARGKDREPHLTVAKHLPLIWYSLKTIGSQINEMKLNRKRGRPKVQALSGTDAYRAYSTWALIKQFGSREYTNREAVNFVRTIDRIIGRDFDGVFPMSISAASAEQSLSRGKKVLEFTGPWDSAVCENLFCDFKRLK